MKPMPASLMQRVTPCGVNSMFTPSAASTSAAPERDERARLPCLATATPAPATIKAAQVEMLKEPEASPPVPTTSIASGGAATRSIFSRIAVTAPVISSTVSPRTRSAMRSAPICEGVASPDIMVSNPRAASSRLSVAPVAALVPDLRQLAVNLHRSTDHCAAIGFPNRLVAEAHAEQGYRGRRLRYEVEADAGVARGAGTR